MTTRTRVPGTVVRSPADVATLGTILGVWAHPDDEAYLCGGLYALARDAGARVICVTATRGELGGDPTAWPPERLAAQRTAELTASLAELGVDEHHWLDLPDGGCAALDPEPQVARLAALITTARPDTVLTFGPDGATGHPDHRAVSAWTTAAFRRAAAPGARLLHTAVTAQWWQEFGPLNERWPAFEQGTPALVSKAELAVDLVLDGPVLARKVAALRAQTSQTAELAAEMGDELYTRWVRDEAFVDAT